MRIRLAHAVTYTTELLFEHLLGISRVVDRYFHVGPRLVLLQFYSYQILDSHASETKHHIHNTKWYLFSKLARN